MGSDVRLENVTMRFGAYTAVKNADLHVEEGEFFSLLGSSGCGKTTILRMISGFLDPSEGSILIGGKDMRGIGPHNRPTALIFQNLALFPLMSVAMNIGFGLAVRTIPAKERKKRVQQLLELIAMSDAAHKMVQDLSGGQRQRVAIARALAVEPRVLLLDEPLSALDLKLRQHMRQELRAIQRRTGVTFIYITHDQGEALTMSDRVGVMSQAVIEQVATPTEIYNTPATAFVAGFVGSNNMFRGRVLGSDNGFAVLETPMGALRGRNLQNLKEHDEALLFVRPEAMRLHRNGKERTGAGGNVLSGRLSHEHFEGPFRTLFLHTEGSQSGIVLHLTNDGAWPVAKPGETLRVAFAPDQALVLPTGGAPHA
jgi:spermidine/putrescine transport system ATP-binding protein